jgi:hypothetical protein
MRTWWLLPEQQRDYPNLSKMALDILSIPAMSASVEHLFSSSNITVFDRRNRLKADTIEVIESLKSWQKIKGLNVYTKESRGCAGSNGPTLSRL